jgi:AcrR family transcriptional regulator
MRILSQRSLTICFSRRKITSYHEGETMLSVKRARLTVLKSQKAPRSRDASLTRSAILEAARKLFAKFGYDGVGVRDIASEAGIDVALINRYFGSKKNLLVETLNQNFLELRKVFKGDSSDLGERLTRHVLTSRLRDRDEGLVIFLRSISNPDANPILRKKVEDEYLSSIARCLRGSRTEERASLIAAFLFGLVTLRDVVGCSPLEDASVDSLVKTIAPLIQAEIDRRV